MTAQEPNEDKGSFQAVTPSVPTTDCRRRAEIAARLDAAQQESIRRHQEVAPRRLSEIGRASLAAMLNTLRGG
ncbi:MAG TPA: hypothetical protein P5552_08930 [Candidatus Competibacteraceae bacterium]|nr:hypothetical protein [Candidatus Competibacteraceae bacterium]